MQNGLPRKKVNSLLLLLKTLMILQLAYLKSASSAKNNIDQTNSSNHKRNVIIAMMLTILPNFVKKRYFQGPARQKNMFHVY